MRIICSFLLAPAAFGLPIDSSEVAQREVPRPSSYADVVEKAQKSVVSVYPATLLTESADEDQAFLDRYFGRTGEDDDKRISGHGSGVIVGADGLILTNNHVVRTASGSLADEILVELHTGRRHPATLVGTDPLTDIAVLKMEPSPDGPPLPIADSSNVRVGDLVFAIGNPFEVGMTVTMGCVSATRRRGLNLGGPGSFEDFLQTDASINPGNSGGALVDASGRLVGINTAIRSAGGGSVGIGFAVPSRLAVHVADHLVAHGRVVRSRLGISVTTVKPDKNGPGGARIASVEPASPAARAGLRPGDILVEIDSLPVPDEAALRLYSSLMPPGVAKPLTLWRDGKRETLHATFEEIPADDNTEGADGAAEVLRGVALRPNDQPEGLRVDAIEPDSPHDGRLQVGQIILEINGTKTASLAVARSALKRGVNQLRVHHDGTSLLVALRIHD
ncbi:MAG: trypsin-like peptidase domain-containing protein [Verrucomicrobiales bacterium]